MHYSELVEIVLNIFFDIECIFEIIAKGFILDKGAYLRNRWNVLDFFIVIANNLYMLNTSKSSAIKIITLLHTTRPLRFISHSLTMKLVVTSLFKSLKSLFNVGLIIFVIWYMFAIFGMSFLSKKMQFCKSKDNFEIGKILCSSLGYNWEVYHPNFDQIFNSLSTIFILGSRANWNEIMHMASNSNGIHGVSLNVFP